MEPRRRSVENVGTNRRTNRVGVKQKGQAGLGLPLSCNTFLRSCKRWCLPPTATSSSHFIQDFPRQTVHCAWKPLSSWEIRMVGHPAPTCILQPMDVRPSLSRWLWVVLMAPSLGTQDISFFLLPPHLWEHPKGPQLQLNTWVPVENQGT